MSAPARDEGGAAFPEPAVYDAGRGEVNPVAAYGFAAGMTLRDYLAAKAMPALMRTVQKNGKTGPDADGNDFEWVARRAYMQADAMLKARQA